MCSTCGLKREAYLVLQRLVWTLRSYKPSGKSELSYLRRTVFLFSRLSRLAQQPDGRTFFTNRLYKLGSFVRLLLVISATSISGFMELANSDFTVSSKRDRARWSSHPNGDRSLFITCQPAGDA